MKEKSALLEVLGDSPRARVLDFLITYAGFDYSKTQVAREAGISRITIDGIWKDLESQGIIARTRAIGNAELYVLNAESPKVRALAALDHALGKAGAEAALEKQALKAAAGVRQATA